MAEAKVKCANCGFLSARGRESDQIVEMSSHTRETGDLSFKMYGTEAPLCFVMAADLRKEYLDTPVTPKPWERLLLVITLDRECSEFCDWMRGFTPKEHAEMIKADAIRRATEQQQREMREWQAQQRKEEREWQVAQEKSRRRFQILTSIIGPIVGALLALLGWLGSQLLSK